VAQETKHGQSASGDQRKIVDERWDEIRSSLRSQWPALSNDDLNMIDGDSRKLVALVHQKTNLPLHEIEEGIDAIASRSHGLLSRIMRTTSDLTESAARQVESARRQVEGAARQVTEPVGRAVREARQMVVERPLPSIGTVFAAGFVLGLLASRLTAEE
jgi:ElaB/YqjD/DUF883 family membrane-anchored ribosome-binding protein